MSFRNLLRGRYVLFAFVLSSMSLWAAPLQTRPAPSGDSVEVPSIEAFRALVQRMTRLEGMMNRILGPGRRPPPIDIPPPVDPPPVVPPPTGWPVAPAVSLLYDTRLAAPIRETLSPVTWELRGNRRFSRAATTIEQTQFLVWFEQVEGLNATRVTVGAINGLDSAGPRYFEHYRVSVGSTLLVNLLGRHIIPPRFAILRRVSTGPDADALTHWTYLPSDPELPTWAPAQAAADTVKRKAFPFQKHGGAAVDIGPYNFFWPDHSLGDSHGGYGVAPFHGGPDDWLVCPEGRENRETEMLLAFQRPIWMLNADYTPFIPFVPYWMGRTTPHEPPGYQFTLDGWCPYAAELITYKFHDFSHLSRGTGGPGALAAYDIVGEDCLGMAFADFKTAYSLDPLHPGKDQTNFLLMPLWKKIEVSNGPSGGGDRTLGHLLRLLRWCRPYFDTAPYDAAMRTYTRKLSDMYGVTHGGNIPWMTTPGTLTVPLTPLVTYTFHQQLTLYEMGRFGGLDGLVARARHFLTSRPPAGFETRPGNVLDTVFDRNNSASASQASPKWGYLGYGQMTHNVWVEFGNAADFKAAMQARGVNGASQDFDCTPRSLWAPGVPR